MHGLAERLCILDHSETLAACSGNSATYRDARPFFHFADAHSAGLCPVISHSWAARVLSARDCCTVQCILLFSNTDHLIFAPSLPPTLSITQLFAMLNYTVSYMRNNNNNN